MLFGVTAVVKGLSTREGRHGNMVSLSHLDLRQPPFRLRSWTQ